MSKNVKSVYSYTLLIPAAIVYVTFFIVPTVFSFFFSLTRWTLIEWEFIGLENFIRFLKEPQLFIGFKNTLIFTVVTCVLKVIFGVMLAVLLTMNIKTKHFLRSVIFFPTLISFVAVGITFKVLMHPTSGWINQMLGLLGISGPNWLGSPRIAIYSVALVDVWKGVGFATVILIAGIMSIPKHYYEALEIDGGNRWNAFWHITLPLTRPAINIILTLSMIYGMRTFDLVWTMTGGGPGFSSDVIASIIYKQYQAGFYGLSTAGNVLLFLAVMLIVFPFYKFLTRKEVSV